MATISKFDKATAKMVSEEVLSALRAVAEKHGLGVVSKGGKYSLETFTPRFEFAIKSKEGILETTEAKNFKVWAESFGLTADDLGKTFLFRGSKYTITGLKPSAPKFPILAKREDGRGFKFPAESVKFGLQRK